MNKDQAMIHVLMKENDELKLEIGRLRNNSIIIPDNATNGDMIKAMFPSVKVLNFANIKIVEVEGLDTYSAFTSKWWNAPYNPPKQNLAPADKSGLEYADQPTLQSAT